MAMTDSAETMDWNTPALFPAGWYAPQLRGYRPHAHEFTTYSLYPYASLPPLEEPSDDFAWLTPLSQRMDHLMRHYRNPVEERGEVAQTVAQAEELGLTLPAPFTRLMGSPALQDQIPSPTACYFEFADRPFACPGAEGVTLLRFLHDQQEALHWYLALSPEAGERVVAGTPYLEDALAWEADDPRQTEALATMRVCAPSFLAFIYRYWLEGTIWFKLMERDPTPLTDEERRYLAHYHHHHP